MEENGAKCQTDLQGLPTSSGQSLQMTFNYI